MVKRALQDGLRRSAALSASPTAEIRPYLQAFTLGQPRYEAFHVREQIRAAEELGIGSWVLWNPGSRYDPAIFRTATEADLALADARARAAEGTRAAGGAAAGRDRSQDRRR
jgi:hypothetical protein